MTSPSTGQCSSQPTVVISPSACQCSNQQAAEDDDNSCNAVAICVPVAVVIAVVVCVVVFVVVWRLRQKTFYSFAGRDQQTEMVKVYNDLYGSVALYTYTYT